MKRKLSILLILVLLFTALPLAAAAGTGDSQARISYVTDTYGLLSESETAALESQAARVSEKYGFSLYIVVLRDYTQYADTTFRCAQDIYSSYELGWGKNRDGALLMLSMAERDYELLFHGAKSDEAFTEYGRDRMEERFLTYFRNNDFAGGFREYLNCSAEYLQAHADGKPVDREKHFSLLSLLPGAVAALITGAAVSAPMKSVGLKTNADAYLVDGHVQLTARSDMFVNRTVTRVPRNTDSNRSGGSGSSHRSGSYSGRSGKF